MATESGLDAAIARLAENQHTRRTLPEHEPTADERAGLVAAQREVDAYMATVNPAATSLIADDNTAVWHRAQPRPRWWITAQLLVSWAMFALLLWLMTQPTQHVPRGPAWIGLALAGFMQCVAAEYQLQEWSHWRRARRIRI